LLRAISNFLLSLLMVATLLWGGCVSCSRFFMVAAAKSDCCNKGQCDRPTNTTGKKDCNRMPLGLQGAPHVDAGFIAIAVGGVVEAAERPARQAMTRAAALLEHSPPDLTVLLSTFLI
jgi:hypothetical protein